MTCLHAGRRYGTLPVWKETSSILNQARVHLCKPNGDSTILTLRTNHEIHAPSIRLIGVTGEQIGILPTTDALRFADEADLDLVEISPDATPPVCKIMDYGKHIYEQSVKDRESRKHQKNTEIKEMKFRLRIEENDYETKKRHIIEFLEGGHKVKVTVMLKGREQSRPDAGYRLLARIAEDLADLVKTDMPPALYGRDITMVFQPVNATAGKR